MHQSLSLSLSLNNNCKNGLDPDQTRMELRKERFANLKKLCILLEVRKADAHDKMGFQYIHWSVPCGTGVKESGPPPPENHKNIEYLSNTGPDPLKFSKLPSQHSTLGHYRHPSETPFKWRFAGVPMMARFCDIWILSPLKRCQSCRVGPPLTKLSGSAHGSSSEAVVT